MFEILVYLFENYIHASACPGAERLARRLSDAGFDDEEISEALIWLDGLRQFEASSVMLSPPSGDATRLYVPAEACRLDADCQGFLMFLESAGLLDPIAREQVIERALALDGLALNLPQIKVIVLMVMWQQGCTIDTLTLDELLTEPEDPARVVVH